MRGLAVKPHWCYSNPWDALLARGILPISGALNSAVECHLHTVEVAGSNPAAPTSITCSMGIYFPGFARALALKRTNSLSIGTFAGTNAHVSLGQFAPRLR